MDYLLYHYSKKQVFWFAIFVLLYEISVYLANDMIMPGMLKVVHTFSASDNWISLGLSAFIFGGASLQLVLGPISDRFGRYKVMLIGVGFFVLTNILAAYANSITMFMVTRFLQGMGLCFISVVGYATLHEIFMETQAVRIISIMNNITILAPLGGPLLGVLVLSYFPWEAIFFFTAAFAGISFVGLAFTMPETVGSMRRDGTLHEISSLRFAHVKNNYLLLLRNRQFMLASFAFGVVGMPIIAWIGLSPLILMRKGGLTILSYGLWQIPIFISAILGTICMRALLLHFPLAMIVKFGSRMVLITLIALIVLNYVFRSHFYGLIAGMSLYSFALGLVGMPLNRIALFSTTVPKGTASALLSMINMVIAAISVEAAGLIYMTLNNTYFAFYCAACGLLFYAFYRLLRLPNLREE